MRSPGVIRKNFQSVTPNKGSFGKIVNVSPLKRRRGSSILNRIIKN